MSYQLQDFSPPPLPPDLVNAHTFQQLRESVKNYLSLQTKFQADFFKQVVQNANRNFQGAGPQIVAARTITVTQSIHTVIGQSTIDTIRAPQGFQGGLVLASRDGFTIENTGNIRLFQSPNYLDPGAYVHLTYHPLEGQWYMDTCRLQNHSGGGGTLLVQGTTANTFLQWVGASAGWSLAALPSDVNTGDLLYGVAAHVWGRLADAATGQVLASGGVGLPPAYTDTPTVTDLTATGTVQGAAVIGTTSVSSATVVASGTVQGATVTATGALNGATLTVSAAVAQGGGLKHQRITTGSIAASTSADVTLTWTVAFADANYSPSASVIEATGSLRVIGIKSISATQVVVSVHNDDGGGAHTGTLAVIALHD